MLFISHHPVRDSIISSTLEKYLKLFKGYCNLHLIFTRAKKVLICLENSLFTNVSECLKIDSSMKKIWIFSMVTYTILWEEMSLTKKLVTWHSHNQIFSPRLSGKEITVNLLILQLKIGNNLPTHLKRNWKNIMKPISKWIWCSLKWLCLIFVKSWEFSSNREEMPYS